MRDHVTKERISAYVDGELEGDELRLVEDLLAESAEYRQLASELQELRASMQSLPSFKLPADFAASIVNQIEDLEDDPSDEPVHSNRGKPVIRHWRSTLAAVASLAAMITVAMMLRPSVPPVDPNLPGGGPDVELATLPVYLQREPQQWVMVYDVTVTPAGRQNDVVMNLLRRHGFGVDPGLKMPANLEDELIAFRSPLGLEEQAKTESFKKPRQEKLIAEQVEMIYLTGMLLPLGDFGRDLHNASMVGDEVSACQLDMVFEPNRLGVMRRLHGSAREHFAASSNGVFSDAGQAFRLSFNAELTSFNVPGLARLPAPVLRPRASSSIAATSELSLLSQNNIDPADLSVDIGVTGKKPGVDGKVDVVRTREPLEAELRVEQTLLIIRYANGGE